MIRRGVWGGSAWLFPAGSVTPGGVVTPPEPPVSEASYPVYDIFTRYPDGAVPSKTEKGWTWGQFSGPGYVTNGGYDSVQGTGASYMEIKGISSNAVVSRVGARFRFNDMGGTRTTNGATLCIGTWADGGITGPGGFGRRTRCHHVVTPTGMSYFVRDQVPPSNNNNVAVTNIRNFGVGGTRLAMNVIHRMEVVISGTTASIYLNNQPVQTVTDARIGERAGEVFPFWEPYYGNESTDPRMEVLEVWADGVNIVPPITVVEPPPATGDPVATFSTPYLPFDMPERQLLTAAPKRAYAHYFVPYPRSINNTASATDGSDWYHNRWIGRNNGTGNVTTGAPDGAGTPNLYGGLLRDRPLPRAQRPSGWQVADKIDEVNWARDAGYDGWMLDMLGVGTGNNRWTQQLEMHDAIEQSGHADFKLGLMPDANASTANSVTTLADNIAAVMGRSSTLRRDGRLVIAPYTPETKGPQFWADLRTNLQARGEDPFYIFCFQSDWTASPQAPAHAYLAQGLARWGDRDPVAVRSSSNQNAGAVAYMRSTYPGKLWMHPVAPGDERPVGIGGSRYWERWGMENWRAAWEVAINTDADMVQVPTWNDISEHSHIVPSLNHGYSYVDVGAYYLIRYKLGYWPKIKRDGGYLSHRIRPSWVAPAQGQTSPQVGYGMTAWQARSGSTPHYDDVELLLFLTADCTVEITSGGQTTTHQVTATGSPQRVLSSIKGIGQVSARIIRNGQTVQTVTSPQQIVSTPWVQDMNYRVTSGLRQALGQHPTTAP